MRSTKRPKSLFGPVKEYMGSWIYEGRYTAHFIFADGTECWYSYTDTSDYADCEWTVEVIFEHPATPASISVKYDMQEWVCVMTPE